jgi:hypothetical protein
MSKRNYNEMTDAELLDEAREMSPVNADGSQNKEDVIRNLELIVPINIPDAKRRRARDIFKDGCKPGEGAGIVQMCLPGMEVFEYDPKRMVMGPDDGTFMLLYQATPKYTLAEKRRSRKHLQDVTNAYHLKDELYDRHLAWAIEQAQHERKDHSFGTFIAENGRMGDAPPSPLEGPGKKPVSPHSSQSSAHKKQA